MSQIELTRFLQHLSGSPDLVPIVKALLHDAEAVIQWAGDRGFDLSHEDVEKLRESSRELSDDDLDQAAGGDTAWVPPH